MLEFISGSSKNLSSATSMKLTKLSSTFNAYVAQKLKKKLKINFDKTKMPTLSSTTHCDLKVTQMSPVNRKIETNNIADAIKVVEIVNNESSSSPSSSPQSTPPSTPPTIHIHPATSAANAKPTVPQKRSATDFRFGKQIGEGSFSTVYLAEDIHTRKQYAIKVCDKRNIIRERKQEYVKRESEALKTLSSCKSFVSLYCTFQDATNLYYAMTYAKNGDLLPYINKSGAFHVDCTRFYAAELVVALEEMHCKGVIHRDLKPENILLDQDMHVLIADFGSAKIVASRRDPLEGLSNADLSVRQQMIEKHDIETGRRRRNSFVGTAQYVSPEVLKGETTSRATDLWALGCIVYQMISGLPPFQGGTDYVIFQKVLKLDMTYPEGFDTDAQDLVQKLIQLDPAARLGSKDMGDTYESIRKHKFFDGFNWDELRSTSPPLIHPCKPCRDDDADQRKDYIPEDIAPGLGQEQLQRLMALELGTSMPVPTRTTSNSKKSLTDISPAEKQRRLAEQATNNRWHCFAEGELILKEGYIVKHKGLSHKRRMLLLTTGPKLIYIDPDRLIKKGEIPWTCDLSVEAKNFKMFFVYTPKRIYYLEDPKGFGLTWCNAIEEVHKNTYKK